MRQGAGQWTTGSSSIAQSRVLQEVVNHRGIQIAPQYPKVFSEHEGDPNRPFFDIGAYAELGTFSVRKEGQAPTFGQPQENIPAHFDYTTYALGARFTRESQTEDPLKMAMKAAKMLADSSRVTKDLTYFSTFNQGWNPLLTGPDGQPLFSTAHLLSPIYGNGGPISGVGMQYSNDIGPMQLTPQSLNLMEQLFFEMLSDAGLPSEKIPAMLMTSVSLNMTSREVVNSPYQPNTSSNTVNTEYGAAKPYVCRYLTSPYSYFLGAEPGGITGDGGGSSLITSHKFMDDVWTWYDNLTREYIVTDEYRSSFGFENWRGWVGSQGAGPM